jgi:hypothetical protein
VSPEILRIFLALAIACAAALAVQWWEQHHDDDDWWTGW